jgi:hypothetical protein
MYLLIFILSSALIVQWLGHLVVAEKTWVRFPLGAHNVASEDIANGTTFNFSFNPIVTLHNLLILHTTHSYRGGI